MTETTIADYRRSYRNVLEPDCGPMVADEIGEVEWQMFVRAVAVGPADADRADQRADGRAGAEQAARPVGNVGATAADFDAADRKSVIGLLCLRCE